MKIGTRAASRSFEPSRGGTGIILKIARNRLRRAADTHSALTVSPECAATPSSTMAKSTLLARTCHSHQRQALQSPAQLVRIRIHRLAPADKSRSGKRHDQRQYHRPKPVHVG